jgi:hypothetical protein
MSVVSGYVSQCIRGFGATVKTHSHRRDGQFRLAYLESEIAVTELER